jgi:NAD(P)-dependent dehydrogenase (short-subunit alcohol dehydrogenase family)
MTAHPQPPAQPLAVPLAVPLALPLALPREGRVAVVTGGSRGLGKAMAMAFAEAGADVLITSRKVDSCRRTADEIIAATGRRAVAYGCHVGKWDELPGLVDAAYDAFGKVDVLVNNAGIAPLYPSLAEVTEELFDKVIAVNLKGPFRLTALFGQRMVADGSGSIINISSIAAVRPTPRELPYAAAKAALNTITVGFAQALGPVVRVNTIMAGPFFTDIAEGWDMVSFAEHASHLPLKRGGQPAEIVGAALYFAGDASSFTTGTVLPVDGGSSIARF